MSVNGCCTLCGHSCNHDVGQRGSHGSYCRHMGCYCRSGYMPVNIWSVPDGVLSMAYHKLHETYQWKEETFCDMLLSGPCEKWVRGVGVTAEEAYKNACDEVKKEYQKEGKKNENA